MYRKVHYVRELQEVYYVQEKQYVEEHSMYKGTGGKVGIQNTVSTVCTGNTVSIIYTKSNVSKQSTVEL